MEKLRVSALAAVPGGLTKVQPALFDFLRTRLDGEQAVAVRVAAAEVLAKAKLDAGQLMALADTLGAYATLVNLKDGQGTTTIESKTNFLAPAPVGTTVRAECAAIHRGRRTMVWQTRVTAADGRLLAIVTQTQMVLEARS